MFHLVMPESELISLTNVRVLDHMELVRTGIDTTKNKDRQYSNVVVMADAIA